MERWNEEECFPEFERTFLDELLSLQSMQALWLHYMTPLE